MLSPPNKETPPPVWHKGLHWKTSDAFRVQWLSRTETPFWRVGHLHNPLNENLQVFVAKDGQEFPFDLGCELVSVMDDVHDETMGLTPVTERRYDDKRRYDEPESPGRGRPRDYTKRTGPANRSRSRGPSGHTAPQGLQGPPRTTTGFAQRSTWVKREPHDSGGTW
jgi:hypothetical protein